MPLEHWMTFATFSEQEVFTYPDAETYHGIVLNANMVAHAPAGIAAFLLEKVAPATSFLIDPMTHAFQHNPEVISSPNGAPKTSIRNLAGEYGPVIQRDLGLRPVTPASVLDGLPDFCRQVLNFQWDYLARHFEANDSAKYLEGDVIKRPSVLVAPYFYLTEDNIDLWAPVVRACAEYCVQRQGEFPGVQKMYSALVISRSILQVDARLRQATEIVLGVGLDGVLLWVDEFDEAGASSLELQGFLKLCGILREGGLDVLNLHGGYFSCLAGSAAFGSRLTGVSHGPEFGEARGVVPVGGGIPISRYYVPNLHVRMKFREFIPVAWNKGWLTSSDVFHAQVCSCQECVATLAGNPENFQLFGDSEVKSIKRRNGVVRIEFPTTEAKKRCLRHYLCAKNREFEFVRLSGADTLLGDLQASSMKYQGADSAENIAHLARWMRALGDL